MSKPTKKSFKTERILSIYRLFLSLEEVSMQELRNSFRKVSDKTFSRDIAVLKRAGVSIRFSGRRKAFVLINENGNEIPRTRYLADPVFPEGKKERQFIEKIRRFVYIIGEMPEEDCDVWYRDTFPDLSKRTMQRDFEMLKNIGYVIRYKRAWDNPWDKNDERPPGHYYIEDIYHI